MDLVRQMLTTSELNVLFRFPIVEGSFCHVVDEPSKRRGRLGQVSSRQQQV